LTRFYDPTEGEVRLDGVDLRDFKLADLRRQFAVVPQDPVLFSTSIAENIGYAKPAATKDELIAAAQAANAHEFIERLPEGYDARPPGDRCHPADAKARACDHRDGTPSGKPARPPRRPGVAPAWARSPGTRPGRRGDEAQGAVPARGRGRRGLDRHREAMHATRQPRGAHGVRADPPVRAPLRTPLLRSRRGPERGPGEGGLLALHRGDPRRTV